jgi:DNA-binding response OmpR family regulator
LARILLVEDEADLMQLYGDVLRGAGHEIDAFTDPLKAYFYFSKKADQYYAVITDVMMNGMSGLELAKKLKEINIDVRIFLMSAFDITGRYDADLKEINLKEFLQKPFHMRQLVAMVEKHIGQQAITNSPQMSSSVI